MLDPFARPALSMPRLSKPALATAVALHLGLLWVAMNSAPLVRSTEQVVYQWVAPITSPREVSGPITLPSPAKPVPKTAAPPVPLPAPAAPPRAAITERTETAPPEPKPEPKPVPAPVTPPPPVPVPVAPPPPAAEPAPVAEPVKPLPEPSRVRREPVPLPLPVPVLDTKIDIVNPTVNVQVQAPVPVAPPATRTHAGPCPSPGTHSSPRGRSRASTGAQGSAPRTGCIARRSGTARALATAPSGHYRHRKTRGWWQPRSSIGRWRTGQRSSTRRPGSRWPQRLESQLPHQHVAQPTAPAQCGRAG
jgi:hypothetical protein